MKRPLFCLAALLFVPACEDPDTFDPEIEEEIEEEDVVDDLDEPEDFAIEEDLDPEGIVNGWTYDSDRDVMVTGPAGLCSGTLLRNDTVLTAKHCVSTDGTPNGPWAAANTITVTQDGRGATTGAISGVTTIARLWTEDVAMLQLNLPMTMEGRATGAFTQIWGEAQSNIEGQATLCQGWGMNTCTTGQGTLRAGLMTADTVGNQFISYDTLGNFNQLQWRGDSGSSCRLPVFEEPHLRKVLGVQTTGICGTIANETAPDRYRDWAHATMSGWEGDFLDTFSSGLAYEVEEPANMLQGPTNWFLWGNALVENSNAHTAGSAYEGSRYISSTEVVTDALVSVKVSSPDNDSAGLLFRYVDDEHYYRVSFDEQRNFARIVRRSGNSWVTIAEDTNFSIDWSTTPKITVGAADNFIAAYVDDEMVLWGFDDDFKYTAGRVGIYKWALTNAVFDDFEIFRF